MILKLNGILLKTIALSTQIFIAFFIWQTNNDLQALLYFTLTLFIFIPIGSLVSGILKGSQSPKYGILIGNWIQVIQITLLLYYFNSLSLPIILITGALGGFAQGEKDSTNRILEVLTNESGKENIEKFYATKTFLLSLLKGIVPLSIAYLVGTTGSYKSLFVLVVVLLLLSSIVSVFVDVESQNSPIKLRQILTIPGTNPNKLALIMSLFFEGLTEGITTTILPIIILVYVGNIINWGWINTGVVAFTIITSAIMRKSMDNAGSRGTYSLGSIIFAITSILFIIHYNIIVIGIFLLAMALMDIIKETSFNSSVERIANSDNSESDLTAEYIFLADLATSIGKVVPIILILLTAQDINNETFVRILLIITGFLPLMTITFLAKTSIFSQDPGVAEKAKEGLKIEVPKPINSANIS